MNWHTQNVFRYRNDQFCVVIWWSSHQRTPGRQKYLSGAVANARGNPSCAVHGPHRSPLPRLLRILHQIHCEPLLSQALQAIARRRPLLPQPVLLIMGHGCTDSQVKEQMVNSEETYFNCSCSGLVIPRAGSVVACWTLLPLYEFLLLIRFQKT